MSEQALTGNERYFDRDDVIVTKTDLGGRITYANDVFLNISELNERKTLGAPHNLIRHPHMPSSIFRLMWETIQQGREIFAYVLNRAANGDHYWVFAHVTPTLAPSGEISGYHSNRRVPDRQIISTVIEPLYRDIAAAERAGVSRVKGIGNGMDRINAILAAKGVDYERFIFSLQA